MVWLAVVGWIAAVVEGIAIFALKYTVFDLRTQLGIVRSVQNSRIRNLPKKEASDHAEY